MRTLQHLPETLARQRSLPNSRAMPSIEDALVAYKVVLDRGQALWRHALELDDQSDRAMQRAEREWNRAEAALERSRTGRALRKLTRMPQGGLPPSPPDASAERGMR